MKKEKILPFDYMKGAEFTENLKNITKSKTFLEMAELLDVPKATFSTWNLHDRTSHELMVRLHLALGIPIEELALKPEDRNKLASSDAKKNTPTYHSAERSVDSQANSIIIKSYCLTNGELLDTGELPYAERRMNSFNLKAEFTIEVETNEALYLVDKSSTNPVSGKYLIDIDGTLSINHIQRLPGKKLAVVFGDSTVDVAEEDIKVIGRVAVTLKKD
ncbi:chromosome partitioning protein ParA [Vibrio parahaemolyticus]|uniref:phage repressor protein CI n=1 Tax=Vibrio parahaemolyticus TaxID=670 RepID=UPI001123A319|nr:phage repressor protein CI [Vibrio parahaemolyticus]TOG86596.1 chromosome partitioning protein ParA [Vibrio parahaemolyticus]